MAALRCLRSRVLRAYFFNASRIISSNDVVDACTIRFFTCGCFLMTLFIQPCKHSTLCLVVAFDIFLFLIIPKYTNGKLGRQVKLIKSSTSFEGAIFEWYAGLRVGVEI